MAQQNEEHFEVISSNKAKAYEANRADYYQLGYAYFKSNDYKLAVKWLKKSVAKKIGKAKFQNPVTVASGTFGHSEKYYNLEEVKALGALTLKTVTLHAQEGNPPPRIVETPAGMLNAIGIENPGVVPWRKAPGERAARPGAGQPRVRPVEAVLAAR